MPSSPSSPCEPVDGRAPAAAPMLVRQNWPAGHHRLDPARTHDPDGHKVRFYTLQHHTEPEPGTVTVVNDARESAERHERATAGQP